VLRPAILLALLASSAAIAVLAAPAANAQTAADFPDLTIKEAAEKIRAVTNCESFGHEITGIRSALADQRVVSVRRAADRQIIRVVFEWAWGDWDGQGMPAGEWRFKKVASTQSDREPKVPDERVKKTIADIRAIATAVESYAVDWDLYPDTDISNLWRRVVPTYIRRVPSFDAWGHPFLYRVSADRSDYLIASPGADGLYQTPEAQLTPPVAASGKSSSSNPAIDLIFSNGSFISWCELGFPDPPDTPQELKEALPCTPTSPPQASEAVDTAALP